MKKISLKIILTIVLCTVTVAVLIGGASIVRSGNIMEEKSRQEIQLIAQNHAGEIGRQFEFLQSKTDGLADIVSTTIDMDKVRSDPAYITQYLGNIDPVVKKFAEAARINLNAYLVLSPELTGTELVQLVYYADSEGKGFASVVQDLPSKDVIENKEDFGWYYGPVDAGKGVWSDPYYDDIVKKELVTYSTPITVSGEVIGMVGMDIKFDAFKKMIDDIKPYTGSYAFLMNASQNFIVHPTLKKEQDMRTLNNGQYRSLSENMDKKPSGVDHVIFGGKDKLLSYARLSNGFILAVSAPQAEVLKIIGQLTFFILMLLAISVVVSIGLASFIGIQITRPIRKLTDLFKMAETGDLTVRSDVKSKDETGQLSKGFNAMIASMRGLITQMRDMSANVASSSEEMMAASEDVSKVSEQIATAISELAKGASEQAISTENGSEKIQEIVEGLSKVAVDMDHSAQLSERAKVMVSSGEDAVRLQEEKMEESRQVSSKVSTAVSELAEKSREIGQILEVIRSIAEQTNLLSLNAAIEAARAGEQGKGFAVVAEEIRKLAEQSSVSVKKIGSIIKEVQQGVEQTVNEMENADGVMEAQGVAFKKTVTAFHEISAVVTSIADNIKQTAQMASDLNQNATAAGDSISDIASIAQQTAASTEEVSASTEEQSSVIHQISDSAAELATTAARLQEGVKKFRV